MKQSPEQIAAINTLGKNILLSASAGPVPLDLRQLHGRAVPRGRAAGAGGGRAVRAAAQGAVYAGV